MQKLILSLGFGVLFIGATQAQTPSSSVPSDTEISLQEERRNAYQQQSITGITNRKDQLLQEYGSFEAAEAAGAIVKQPLTEGTAQKAAANSVVIASEGKKE